MTPEEARKLAAYNHHRTPLAVTDALRQMAGEVERLTKERDASFAMTRCECGTEEACANLVRCQDEIERLRAELAALKMLHIYAGSCPIN